MNKNSYIKKISEHLCCDIEYAIKIVNILDDNFFISKRSKDKIIKELIIKKKPGGDSSPTKIRGITEKFLFFMYRIRALV